MALTLLTGGTLYDGSGKAPAQGDVLIDGDRIAAVGPGIPRPPSAEVVDCTGLAVAPGFIDLHSHSDLQVLENRREKPIQGVTTEVVGNCGFSPYPCGHDHEEEMREFANGIFRGGPAWRYANAREYLAAVNQHSHLISVESLVGHGSLRVGLFGNRQGELPAAELEVLNGCLRDALDGGSAGFSTGLMYAPGSSAPQSEIEALCRTVARTGKLYATHMRSYSFGLFESTEEQIAIARASGCRLQISHLQTVGHVNWDKQRRTLDRIEHAREKEGVDIEFDIYPYQAGSTVLTQFLPQSALDGGTPALLERLSNPDERARIAEGAVKQLAQRWSDVFITSVATEGNKHVVGKNLEEIGKMRGVEPQQAAIDLILEEKALVNIVSFNQSVENLRELLTHPLCSVISDGFYVNGRPHPRLHGTFPYLLGEIVRDRKWMPLETAIHKITAQPAARLGLGDRGTLTPGLRADVTLFDAAKVAGPASYEEPEQDPVGIASVYRAGKKVSVPA